jgi:hypothetical protein
MALFANTPTTARLLPVLAFLAVPTLAWAGAYDIPGFPGDAPPPASSASCLDKPIEKLAADPHAAAVIDKDIPGLLGDSHYPIFKSMSLRTVAALSSGRISQGTLSEIDQELDAPPTAANRLRNKSSER